MMDQHHEVLFQLAKEDGVAEVFKKILEECQELTTLINDFQVINKYPMMTFKRELTGEIADVLITIHKLIVLFGLESVVDSMIEYKIQRTIYEKEHEDE